MCLSKEDYNLICDAFLDSILYIKSVKKHNLGVHDIANEASSSERDIEQSVREAVFRLNQVIINSSNEKLEENINNLKKELRVN